MNWAKAAKWFKLAADQGHTAAQIRLARMHEGGAGVAQDYGKARELYEAAALQGNGIALLRLGTLYELGRGVPQDFVRAKACQIVAIPLLDGRTKESAETHLLYLFLSETKEREAQRLADKLSERIAGE